jgi:hypothetical protein
MKASDIVAAAKVASIDVMSMLEKKAKKLLRHDNMTLVALANGLNCSPLKAQRLIEKLKLDGYNVSLSHGEAFLSCEIPSAPPLVVDSKDFFDGKRYKFGALGDTHLCNRHARLDVLNSLYDIYEREGITRVFHTGNIVDGECRFNKHELIVRSGFEAQVEYLINEYPVRKGIETWFITGEDHEGWWIQREAINVGERMQQSAEKAGRTDLKWIGHLERDIHFKTKNGFSWGRVMHPGGGSAYATSYTEQKIVEALQGGEKPRFMLIGHYHKWGTGYPREVYTVQTGCTCDQTAFLRRQKIRVDVGGSIIDFHQAPSGEINRFRGEFLGYFDRAFYAKNDKYRTW